MKRLTTDSPKDNIENALNLYYINDNETWVRSYGADGGDISLFGLTRELIGRFIPGVDLGMSDYDLSAMIVEWLMEGVDSLEGVLALLYTSAWAYADLRHRLIQYENTGLEPEDLAQGINAAVRRKVGAEHYGLTPEQMDRAVELFHADAGVRDKEGD